MNKFEIWEERIITGTMIYKWVIEAEDENEAMNIIHSGDMEPISIINRTEDDTYDSEFEIKKVLHL
jgi:hypothetical protein